MKNENFVKLMLRRIEDYKAISIPKGEEYSRNGNRAHNFYVQARLGLKDGETPESALWGDLRKHLASIIDIINDLDEGKLPDPKMLSEKFNDYHVYGHLLEGMLLNRLGNQIFEMIVEYGKTVEDAEAEEAFTLLRVPKAKKKR